MRYRPHHYRKIDTCLGCQGSLDQSLPAKLSVDFLRHPTIRELTSLCLPCQVDARHEGMDQFLIRRLKRRKPMKTVRHDCGESFQRLCELHAALVDKHLNGVEFKGWNFNQTLSVCGFHTVHHDIAVFRRARRSLGLKGRVCMISTLKHRVFRDYQYTVKCYDKLSEWQPGLPLPRFIERHAEFYHTTPRINIPLQSRLIVFKNSRSNRNANT